MMQQRETLLSPVALLTDVACIRRAVTLRRRLAGLPLVMLKRRLATHGGGRANALELPSAAGRLFTIVGGRGSQGRVEPGAPSPPSPRSASAKLATLSDFTAFSGVPALASGRAPDKNPTPGGDDGDVSLQQTPAAAISGASTSVSYASGLPLERAAVRSEGGPIPGSTPMAVDGANRPGATRPLAELARVAPALALFIRGRQRRIERSAGRLALVRATPQLSFAGIINTVRPSKADARFRDALPARALHPSKTGPLFRTNASPARQPKFGNGPGLDAAFVRPQARPSIDIDPRSPIVVDGMRANLSVLSPPTIGEPPIARSSTTPLPAQWAASLLDYGGVGPSGDSALRLPRRSPEMAPVGVGAVVAVANAMRGFVSSEIEDIRKAVERLGKRPNPPQTSQAVAVSDDTGRRVLAKIREIVQEERFRSGKLR